MVGQESRTELRAQEKIYKKNSETFCLRQECMYLRTQKDGTPATQTFFMQQECSLFHLGKNIPL